MAELLTEGGPSETMSQEMGSQHIDAATYEEFPELSTFDYDLDDLKRETPGFFEPKSRIESESPVEIDEEPPFPELSARGPEDPTGGNANPELQELRYEAALLPSHKVLETISERDRDLVPEAGQKLEGIEDQQAQALEHYSSFLDEIPVVKHSFQSGGIDELLDEQEGEIEAGEVTQSTHASMDDVHIQKEKISHINLENEEEENSSDETEALTIEPSPQPLQSPGPSPKAKPTTLESPAPAVAQLGTSGAPDGRTEPIIQSAPEVKPELKPQPLEAPVSQATQTMTTESPQGQELMAPELLAQVEQNVDAMLAMQAAEVGGEIRAQLILEVSVQYLYLQQHPEEAIATLEGIERATQYGGFKVEREEGEASIHTDYTSNLTPMEQFESHLEELARLQACLMLSKLPADKDEEGLAIRYRGDTVGRDKLELAIADQAALTLIAEQLCYHQDDLKEFSHEIESRFGHYRKLSIECGDESDPKLARWMDASRDEDGEIVPGSELAIEHTIDSEGATLTLIIKQPIINQEDHESDSATRLSAEEVPGATEKSAHLAS